MPTARLSPRAQGGRGCQKRPPVRDPRRAPAPHTPHQGRGGCQGAATELCKRPGWALRSCRSRSYHTAAHPEPHSVISKAAAHSFAGQILGKIPWMPSGFCLRLGAPSCLGVAGLSAAAPGPRCPARPRPQGTGTPAIAVGGDAPHSC